MYEMETTELLSGIALIIIVNIIIYFFHYIKQPKKMEKPHQSLNKDLDIKDQAIASKQENMEKHAEIKNKIDEVIKNNK